MDDPLQSDLALSLYYQSLQATLKNELNCIVSIATGQAECKDAVDDNLDSLSKSLDVTGNIFSPLTTIVEIAKHISERLGGVSIKINEEPDKRPYGIALADSIKLYPLPEQREVLLNQVAREITYRFGPTIHYIMKQHNSTRVISKLAKVAALRTWYYAIAENIGLHDSQELANGVIEGFESLRDIFPDFVSRLGEVTALDRDLQDGLPFRAEACYAYCGFVTPQFCFWTHADCERQVRNKYDAPFVQFMNAGQDSRVEYLVPKYGYAQLPSAELPLSYQYLPQLLLRRREESGFNVHIEHCTQFPVRYVGFSQIVHYLQEMKKHNKAVSAMAAASSKKDKKDKKEKSSINNKGSSKGSIKEGTSIPPLSEWLKQHYPDEFECTGALTPTYRPSQRSLDEKHFRELGISFQDGNFTGCDFSYCTFANMTFANFSASRLLFCTFSKCAIAQEHAFHCSDLSFR